MSKIIKKTVFQIALGLAAITEPSVLWAHGEDVPGPHGGDIRMPGAYHIELITKEHSRLDVYLLDLNSKNPMIRNSSVQIEVTLQEVKKTINCTPEKQFFKCALPKGTPTSVNVLSKRNGATGIAVAYNLGVKHSQH